MKKTLLLFAVFVVSAAFLFLSQSSSSEYSATKYGIKGGDFTLSSAKGSWTLSDHLNRPVILYFGFTSCPDVCPMSLSVIKRVLEKVDISYQVVFVSVDFKRDQPQDVDKYAKYFGDDFIGLTGNEAEINQVTSLYSVFYKFIQMPKSEMGYTVDHTSRFFVVDTTGKLVKVIPSHLEDEELIAEFKEI